MSNNKLKRLKEMKTKKMKRTILVSSLFLILILPTAAAQAQTGSNLFNAIVLVPGMTRTIDIRQSAAFPLGCPQFFIAVLGQGTLGISLKKDDAAGDILFMVGIAQSGAGTVPIYRVGVSKGMIDQIVEIGDGDKQNGFVWLYCGVAFSQSVPLYTSQLRLSLEP
jgi:hypothetical protein